MLGTKKAGRLLIGFAAAVVAAAAGAVGSAALDADTVILTEYEQPAAEGMITVGVRGGYVTDADNALAKINSAR